MNMSYEKFMMIVRETNKKYMHPEKWTEVENLINQIMNCSKLENEEILALRDTVENFFASDVSDEDKAMVGEYTESLHMICSAIEGEILQEEKGTIRGE